jgi:RHS repeat-associated protein
MPNANVYFFPAEYNSYGAGASVCLSLKTDENAVWRRHYNITDQLGNTRLVLREDAADPRGFRILGEYNYEAYGSMRPILDTDPSQTRLRYIGKERDEESLLADHGVRKYDYDLGRFTCPDPMWEKYYSWTPYQYAGCNPVSLMDGNGKDYYLVGTQTSAALEDLNSEMPGANFHIEKNGKLKMGGEYEPKNELESAFFKNMNDPKIDVNLYTSNDAAISSGENFMLLPGAYLGASYNESTGKIVGNMALNVEFSKRHEFVGGTSSGISIMHEILEGFTGAKQNGVHTPNDDAYLRAHNAVILLDKIQIDNVKYGLGETYGVKYRHVTGPNGSMLLFNESTLKIFPRKLQK